MSGQGVISFFESVKNKTATPPAGRWSSCTGPGFRESAEHPQGSGQQRGNVAVGLHAVVDFPPEVEDADERGAGRRSVGEGNVAVILGDLVLGRGVREVQGVERAAGADHVGEGLAGGVGGDGGRQDSTP
jgi:hypothetical protein